MEAFFTSTALVALAEIGDKTQLLAIILAARFNRPWPIIWGIFIATLANHFLAALLGASAASFLDEQWFQYVIAASFVLMGLWTLIPDKMEDDEKPKPKYGAFLTTLVVFFLVEIGDKTQLATVALGARYHDALLVTAGSTLGMMIANVPAVFLGQAVLKRVKLSLVRAIAALFFIAIGLWMLIGIWGWV